MNNMNTMNINTNAMESIINGLKKSTEEYGCTEKQMQFIKDLCLQREVEVDMSRCKTTLSASAYINELFSIPQKTANNTATQTKATKPCSEKQIAKITELCNQMNKELPDFSKLDGSFNGTASQLIQKLYEEAKTFSSSITEKQIETMIKMQFCPDCTMCFSNGKPLTEEEIKAYTKKDASAYIAKYSPLYYAWIKTRLSAGQMNEIKRLCDMLKTPYTDEMVIQFDEKTASKYIEQLNWELATVDKETTLEPETIIDRKTNDYEEQFKAMVHAVYYALGEEDDVCYDIEQLYALTQYAMMKGANLTYALDKNPEVASDLLEIAERNMA